MTTAPHDLEAEAAVLGACMLNRQATEQSIAVLAPADFYRQTNADVFAAMLSLYGQGRPADLHLVAHELVRLGKTVETSVLTEIQTSAPASLNARHYAQIVAGHSARRRLIAVLEQAITEAWEPTHDISTIVSGLEHAGDSVRLPYDAIEPAIDAADLVDQHDEYDWIVPQLLERGDRLILTAAEGVGKSTALRSWAVMLASGIHPFNRYEIRRVRVLLVDLENSERQIRRSLKGLLGAAGSRYQGGLNLQCWISGIDLRDPRDFRRLDVLCEMHRPEVLVLGPLYKAFRTRKGENKADETAAEEAAYALDRLRSRHGCALLIEAHSPHGDQGDRAGLRPYGASLWLRWPEFGIGLKRLGMEKAVELKHWRGARDRSRDWPETLYEGRLWPWEPAAPTIRGVA